MDKRIESRNVHKIVEILGKDPVLVEGRKKFHGALGLLPGSLPDIKREYACDTPGFLAKTLHLWISNFGKDATFGKLIGILKDGGFVNLAGELTLALDSNHFDSEEDVNDETRSKDSTGFSFEIPEKALNFTGREQELTELHNNVMNWEGAVIAALSGMGGIGKTTLAAHYVWKYHEGNFSNVIWINAENSASLRSSFKRLANELELMEKTNLTTDEFKKIVADVYKKLTTSKTLFVFDNAENYEEIKPYLPRPNLKTIPPQVLITSRNNKWNDKIKVIQLGLFTPEEALKFLEDYLKLTNPEEIDAAEKLCEALGYLPIAVRQAGVYIKVEKEETISHKSTRESLEVYLKIFEKGCKLLDFEYWKTTGEANGKTTLVTWNITMDKLKKENEMCERIMELIAYLEPDQISTELFGKLDERPIRRKISTSTEENSDSDKVKPTIKSAINLLNQYSIIKKKKYYISVHRLVQKVIRWQNRDRESVLLVKAMHIFCSQEDYDHHCLTLWKYALEHEEVVKRFTDFGIGACEGLTANSVDNDRLVDDDDMKVIKKTIVRFKTVLPQIVAYRLVIMCLEIQLLCANSFPNIVRISELVNEISSNWLEFVRVLNCFSGIIMNTSNNLFSTTERLGYKDEFMSLAYKFYQIAFNVVKYRSEKLTIIDYITEDIHSSYIKLMVKWRRTDEALQNTREFVKISNRIYGRDSEHFDNLRVLADGLIANEEAGSTPHVELIKYSLELNEELYRISVTHNSVLESKLIYYIEHSACFYSVMQEVKMMD